MAKRGINKVTILGNLGNDPETRYMPTGAAVTNISVATSEHWKDKQTGKPQERTEWHRIIFFNRLAEIAGEYLRKGSKVYVEGSLRTRKWTDQSGQDRWTTEIHAFELQLLDRLEGQQGHQAQTQPQQQAQRPQHQQSQADYGAMPPQGYADFEDDIPFNKLQNEYCI